MCKKNDDALMFVCSLIEAIGRQTKRPRSEVVRQLGPDELRRLYEYADVLHCEPIEKVADDCIHESKLEPGTFDNVHASAYQVPSVFEIGKVYERLIEDLSAENDDPLDVLVEIYTSWIDVPISDYNIAVYYQPREYLSASYRAGELL